MPRLFVALRPPPHVRQALLAIMGGIEGARWQDDAQLHLTLRFVGEVEPHAAEDLAAMLGRISAPPFELRLAGVGYFERKGVPHTLWAGLAPSPPLTALNRKVESACRAAGLPPEQRAFAPHVTLARLNRSSGPIQPFLVAHAALGSDPFEVEAFWLFESLMGRAGSHYDPVIRYPLAT